MSYEEKIQLGKVLCLKSGDKSLLLIMAEILHHLIGTDATFIPLFTTVCTHPFGGDGWIKPPSVLLKLQDLYFTRGGSSDALESPEYPKSQFLRVSGDSTEIVVVRM